MSSVPVIVNVNVIFRESAVLANENEPLQVAVLLRSRFLGRFLVQEFVCSYACLIAYT